MEVNQITEHTQADNDSLADMAAVELLQKLEPIVAQCLSQVNRYVYAREMIKAAFLKVLGTKAEPPLTTGIVLNWQRGPALGNDPLDLRCPVCGYTVEDSLIHMDHNLCLGKIPSAPFECGDRLLVLVECVRDIQLVRKSGGGKHSFWDASIIVPTEDGFDDAYGYSWSAWDWSDVSYFVKLDKSNLPKLGE